MKKLLVLDTQKQLTMSTEELATKIKKLGCPFTVVWATNPSHLLQGVGFIACDEMGVSILIQRFEHYATFRPAQQPKPFIRWKGSLQDFLRGIRSQDDQNAYSAVRSFVRENHPYELVAFRADAILRSTGPFAPLAETILRQ